MIGERLAKSRRDRGLTQTELAVEMGDRYNAPMISMVENGSANLLLDGAVNAARELGVSLDYLVGLTDDPMPAAQLLEHMKRLERNLIRMELTGPRASQYTALVQRLHQLAESLSMPRLPGQAAAVTMPDDSMEPNIREGDALLADLDVSRMHEGGIFAVSLGEDLLVRRAGRDTAGRWRLVSDNPAWEPMILPAFAVIQGEVLWAGRNL